MQSIITVIAFVSEVYKCRAKTTKESLPPSDTFPGPSLHREQCPGRLKADYFKSSAPGACRIEPRARFPSYAGLFSKRFATPSSLLITPRRVFTHRVGVGVILQNRYHRIACPSAAIYGIGRRV